MTRNISSALMLILCTIGIVSYKSGNPFMCFWTGIAFAVATIAFTFSLLSGWNRTRKVIERCAVMPLFVLATLAMLGVSLFVAYGSFTFFQNATEIEASITLPLWTLKAIVWVWIFAPFTVLTETIACVILMYRINKQFS